MLLGYLARPDLVDSGSTEEFPQEECNHERSNATEHSAATGLLVIEAVNSNPNGDPDRGERPTAATRWQGRNLTRFVQAKTARSRGTQGGAGLEGSEQETQTGSRQWQFFILESRGRDRKQIENELRENKFTEKYWDGRLFGNTFLEEGGPDTVKSGVVQFGLGVSVAPIEIERLTNTNKAGVEAGKDRGMRRLATVLSPRRLLHALLRQPQPAHKSDCTARDVELMLRLIPFAYPHSRSYVRPSVEVRHAWFIEHKNALGSCSDFALLKALTPVKNTDPDRPSTCWEEYKTPTELPKELAEKVAPLRDLVAEM